MFRKLEIFFLLGLFSVVITWKTEKVAEERCAGILKSTEVEKWFSPPPRSLRAESELYKCLWVMKGLKDKMIRLQFRDLSVDYHEFCKLSRIQVEDDDRLVGLYCGYGDRPPVFTETQHFYIMSVTDPHTGFSFNATYLLMAVAKRQCGGILRDTTSWFSSLDRDNDGWYDSSLTCIWTLEAAESNIIILRFLYMDIRGVDNCHVGDFIEVRNEYDKSGERYCGTHLPPILASESNILKIRFHTEYGEQGEGFNATYFQVKAASYRCGGILSQGEGLITFLAEETDRIETVASNTAESSTRETFECFWIIDGEEDKLTELRILETDIEESSDCQNASLYISDGETTLGKFCGSMLPSNSTITSASNHLFIWLRADEHFRKTHFSATYAQIYDFSSECGELLTSSTGRIFPPDSRTPIDCLWVIQAGANMTINLDVRVLDIELNDPCIDYLMVYTTQSPREKVCGSQNIKNPFRSGSDIVFVRFFSRRSRSSDLNAKYTQIPALDKTCGGVVNATSGFISHVDNDHDGNYDHNLDCLWLIKAGEKKVIFLQFQYFELESSVGCKYDYLTVSEEGSAGERACALVHSTDLHKVHKSNKLYIHFVSDGSRNYKGFNASFEEIDESEVECKREVNATSGWLAPLNRGLVELLEWSFDDCVYLLRADAGKVLELHFLNIHISWTSICISYIQIDFDTKLCWDDILPNYRSNTSVATVLYRYTNIQGSYMEFNISYTHVDDHIRRWESQLMDQDGYITFPNTPFLGVPHYNLIVVWTLKAGYHEVILFKFLMLRLQEHKFFSGNDHVQVKEPHRNWWQLTNLTQAEFFGYNALITEYNSLTVVLITDGWGAGTLSTDSREAGSISDTHGRQKSSPYTVDLNATYSIITDSPFCTNNYTCLMSNTIIPWDLLCDNTFDCPYGDDERFCGMRCPLNCSCVGLIINCTGNLNCKNIVKDKYTPNNFIATSDRYNLGNVLDVTNNPEVYRSLEETLTWMKYVQVLNVSKCEITEIRIDVFKNMSSLVYLDLSYNALRRIASNTFKKQTYLETLRLVGNSEIIFFESEAFSGLSSLGTLILSDLHIGHIAQNAFAHMNKQSAFDITYSIIESVEENAFGDLHTSTLDLETSEIFVFSPLMFERLSNVSKLITNAYRFCCIRPYYLPEKNCFPHKAMFSTCNDLLGSARSRYFLWVTGLLSVLSNVLAIKHHVSSSVLELRFRHHILLMNVAISDFLMGVFVVIIVGADTSLRDNYAVSESVWRSSPWCLISCVLSSMSTVARSMFLFVFTLSRYCVIISSSGQSWFTRKLSMSLTMVAWVIAALTSALPILYSAFFAREVYSKSGVCLGFPIRHDKPIGWFLSTPLLILGSLATALTIILGYWNVRKELTETEANLIRPRLNRTEDLKISRNILTLVLLHILCMVPLFILGVFGWGDELIDSETVGWMTLIILAILSAMNPLMFNLSDMFDIKELTPSADEHNRPLICTEDEFARTLSLLTDQRFWWARTRKRGYVSLVRWLRKKDISYEECALVAIGIATRISELHTRGVSQQDLRARDIFIMRRLGKRAIHIALACRPQVVTKPSETACDIEAFGCLLSRVIEEYDKRRNLQPDY